MKICCKYALDVLNKQLKFQGPSVSQIWVIMKSLKKVPLSKFTKSDSMSKSANSIFKQTGMISCINFTIWDYHMRCKGRFAPLGTFYTLTDVQKSLKPWLRPFLTTTAEIRSLILGYAGGNLLLDKILANYGVPLILVLPNIWKGPSMVLLSKGCDRGGLNLSMCYWKPFFMTWALESALWILKMALFSIFLW